MSDVVPYEKLSTEALVRIFADYSHAVTQYGDEEFAYRIPRTYLIFEIERMHEWLSDVHRAQMPNGNGHR